jgi:hypothetical protein
MDHLEAIDAGVAAGIPYHEIARKVFLVYPTKVFVGNEERAYSIANKIALHFDVPLTSVQVAGSAKTGRSFFQQRDFIAGTSDLDIAIIDPRLFVKYMGIVFKQTKAYNNQTGFPIRGGRSAFDEYIIYLTKGIFRPDLMPASPAKADLLDFFGRLSQECTDLFSNINAAIYLSELFFENKQRSAIKHHADRPEQR